MSVEPTSRPESAELGGIANGFFFREEVTLLGGKQEAQTTLHAVSPQFVHCLRFLKLPSGQLIIS